MRLSMNSGSCYDNAPMESFFHTLKTEQVYLIGSKLREETKSAIFEFIEVFYNRQRSLSRLGYLSPHENDPPCEALFLVKLALATHIVIFHS